MWEESYSLSGNRNVLLVSLNDKQKTWKSSLIQPRTDVGEVELVQHLVLAEMAWSQDFAFHNLPFVINFALIHLPSTLHG